MEEREKSIYDSTKCYIFQCLFCFIVLFWVFSSVLHKILPDLSWPSLLFTLILWLELASRRWPGVLFGVPHHASTPWQPDPHPDKYKVAQPEVAAWPCTRDCFVVSKRDTGTILPGQCLAGMLEPQGFVLSQVSVLSHAGIWILVHI